MWFLLFACAVHPPEPGAPAAGAPAAPAAAAVPAAAAPAAPAPPPPVPLPELPMPADSLDAGRVSSDLTLLRDAVRRYRDRHSGHHPPSFDEIEPGPLAYPGYYEYDPLTGQVTCPEHPAL